MQSDCKYACVFAYISRKNRAEHFEAVNVSLKMYIQGQDKP